MRRLRVSFDSVISLHTDLEVNVADHWDLADDWITKEVGLSLACTAQQHDWWASNDNAFRLLDLPLELRRAIYQEMIRTYV